MNRENKLALIIGFSLILVVGVLISDHLSRAQADRLDEAPGSPGVLVRAASMPANALADQQAIAMATPPPVLIDRQSAAPRADEFLTHAGGRGAVVGAGVASVDSLLSPAGGATLPGFEAVGAPAALAIEGNGQTDAAAAEAGQDERPVTIADAADSLWSRWQSSATRPLAQTARREERSANATNSNAAAGTARGSGAERTEARPESPTATPGVTHTVKPGESLFEIATRYLGSGARWKEIREANRNAVAENGAVRSGVTLTIPGARAAARATGTNAAGTNATGTSRSTTAARPASSMSAKKEVVTPPAKAKPTTASVTYTVRAGDTLAGIARRMLGSPDRAEEILRANRGVISDPNKIQVGMKLTIPKR